MKVNGMEVASWKSIRPQTPQQRDARSCRVFVIKVGLWYAFIIGLFLLTKRGGAVLVEYWAQRCPYKKDRGLTERLDWLIFVIATGYLTAQIE